MIMKEYRKTATIRACLYEPGMEDGYVVDGRYYSKDETVPRAMSRVPAIKTLEGHHVVSPGDWIATGIKGERWPIKPDVFASTYEEVT